MPSDGINEQRTDAAQPLEAVRLLNNSDKREPVPAREYVFALLRQKWLIATFTVAVAGAALGFSLLQEESYRATAKVLVAPLLSSSTQGTLVPININTEIQLADSGPVAALVKQDLGTDVSIDALTEGLNVRALTGTEVLQFDYNDADPPFAQQAANAFAERYVENRTERVAAILDDAQESIRQQMAALQSELDANRVELQSARREDQRAQIARLQEDRESLLVQQGLLQQRLADLRPDELEGLYAGEVVEAAELPTSPVSPDHKRSVVLGGLLGLLLGAGAGLIRENLSAEPR